MDADCVFVERIIEPYTGMPLLGVGGYLPLSMPGTVEVRYDGESAAVLIPTAVDGQLHFATQLPLESSIQRLTVVRVHAQTESVLFDGELSNVGDRAESRAEHATTIVQRALRSLVRGEVFAVNRWRARAGRFAESLLKMKQKMQARRLAHRHPSRSSHSAYVQNTLGAKAVADDFRYRPTISILMPVYNVEPQWFRAAVDSVRNQHYDRWELCIADDASTSAALMREYDRLSGDPRIKLVHRTVNGHISATSNSAAEMATGEFIALLDHDDALAPDALSEVVRRLQARPDADVIYSDEDKIDAGGHRYDPQFKPDWSPDLLLSYNFINHFTVIRRRLFDAVGGFRIDYEGSQDHDLLLRVTERTDRIEHIPRILYHWRSLPTSTAASAGVKTYVHTAGRRAVEDALHRRRISASLFVPDFAKKLGLPILGFDGPDTGPTVAVIVHGPADRAAKTVRAVRANTAYTSQTVYLALTEDNPADALNRMAASRAEAYLLFLEAGIVPADPRWLSRLMGHAVQPGIGAVGGVIRSPDGTILSAGTILGMKDGTGPTDACHGVKPGEVSYYFYAEVSRTVTAVGRGCVLTSRAAFDRVGGFDAERFGRTLFDVDYALRLRGQGLRSVHVGTAELIRADGAERIDDPSELLALRRGHGDNSDPYYNPNLSNRNSFQPMAEVLLTGCTSSKALRALVVAHNLNRPEGAPRYLSEIVLGLQRNRILEPFVLSPTGGAGAKVYADADIPVTIADADWSPRFIDGRWSPRECEAARKYLVAELRRCRPEVVIANTLLTFPVVEAAASLGIPSVWIIHESYSPAVLARLFPPYAQHRIEMAFRLASRIVPASHDTAALFAPLDCRANIRVIHNGIDPAPFDAFMRTHPKLVHGKKRFLAVGTVCERKGQHTLVEAAAILASTRRDFLCQIIGMRDSMPYANYVRHLVARRNLGDCVELIGETDGVGPLYRAADAFVCTSHMETFSRSILEAEAFGLPIISTPCHGISEQVHWGQNALRFEIGDAAGLARKMATLLDDDSLRRAMSRRSRAAFENHRSFAMMLDDYAGVIRAAVGAGQPRVANNATDTRRAA